MPYSKLQFLHDCVTDSKRELDRATREMVEAMARGNDRAERLARQRMNACDKALATLQWQLVNL